MKITITTRDILPLIKGEVNARDIGLALLSDHISHDDLEPGTGIARHWFEKAWDWEVGFAAIDMIKEASKRKKHLKTTINLK